MSAPCVECGNPHCPNRNAINLDSIEDYAIAAPACIICGCARCDVCNPTNSLQCGCSNEQMAALLVQYYLEDKPSNESIYAKDDSVPLALLLFMVGLPTGTTEGLQYILKSELDDPVEKAAFEHDQFLQAATLATGGQPGAQEQDQPEPTDFWRKKAAKEVHIRDKSSSAALNLFYQAQLGPWDTMREQIDIWQFLICFVNRRVTRMGPTFKGLIRGYKAYI